MTAYQISSFRKKLESDPDNLNSRRDFHERYEWLEAYWSRRYRTNHLVQFANEFESFFITIDEFKHLTRVLAGQYPVANSNMNFDISPNILRATAYLRFRSGLFEGDLEFVDTEIKEYGEEWKTNSFHAVMTIIKQIRDNLFHGKKMEIQKPQYQRNKELVSIASKISLIILDNSEKAENSVAN